MSDMRIIAFIFSLGLLCAAHGASHSSSHSSTHATPHAEPHVAPHAEPSVRTTPTHVSEPHVSQPHISESHVAPTSTVIHVWQPMPRSSSTYLPFPTVQHLFVYWLIFRPHVDHPAGQHFTDDTVDPDSVSLVACLALFALVAVCVAVIWFRP